MKTYRMLLTVGPLLATLFAGCGGTTFVDTSELPDTYQCQHMDEVCKEAREFERTYAKLPADEKKDAENILKAYRIQCNDALDVCRSSGKKKQVPVHK